MTNATKTLRGKKDKLFNFRPAFFVGIFLVFGILFGYYTMIRGVSVWWTFSLVPVAVTPFFFCERRKLFIRMLVLALLLATFFLGVVCFRYQVYDYSRCGYYNGTHTVTGTVTSYTEREDSYKIILKGISVDGEEEKGRLVAYLPTAFTKNIHISDVVVMTGNVRTDTEYLKDNFNAYAINDGIRFALSGITAYREAGSSKEIFLLIRDRVEQVVCNAMDETSAAVTLGILTGDTTKIESGLLDNIRRGGIAHIFAVSGLHVGALYGFLLLLFSKTRLKGTHAALQLVILTAILFVYAGICGFSPSILRAMTLCLVSFCMRRLGGATDSINTLGVAAVIILLFTPCALFEIGFQLSFAACLGILFLSKRIGQVCDEIRKAYRKIRPRRYTKEEMEIIENGDTLPLTTGEEFYRAFTSLLSASFAAQFFTAPLQYITFGYLSGWSFLLNLIFVPLISVVFAGLLVLVLVSCVLPLWCSVYLLYIPAMLFNAALLLFEVADFSAFSITAMQLSGECCVCYYGG